jgi:hypothetical protein
MFVRLLLGEGDSSLTPRSSADLRFGPDNRPCSGLAQVPLAAGKDARLSMEGEPPTDEVRVHRKPRRWSDKEPAAVPFVQLGLGSEWLAWVRRITSLPPTVVLTLLVGHQPFCNFNTAPGMGYKYLGAHLFPTGRSGNFNGQLIRIYFLFSLRDTLAISARACFTRLASSEGGRLGVTPKLC